MSKKSIETWMFVLAVVRRGNRFLLVQERQHGQPWYLPAGRVEHGETFEEAIVRETLEEAGIPINIDGILRIEHTPYDEGSARLRVIFLASPSDDTPPKSQPDEETLGARWFTIEEIEEAGLELRSDVLIPFFEQVRAGSLPLIPKSTLAREGNL